jgi:hypothetical protein
MMFASVQITQTTRCLLRIACVAALAGAFSVLRLPLVHATDHEPPSMPTNLQVPEGHKAFLEGHAVGTQNYICLPANTGVASGPSSDRRPLCSTTMRGKSSPTF